MLDAARKYWLGILLATVLGAVTAAGLSLLQPPRYAAEAELILAPPSGELINLNVDVDEDRRAQNAAAVARTGPVAARAAAALGRSAAEVERSFRVGASEDADLLTISAQDATAEGAAELANALAAAYREEARLGVEARVGAAVQELDNRIRLLRDELPTYPSVEQREQTASLIRELEVTTAELQFQRLVYGDGVNAVGPAEAPSAPYQPTPRRAAAVGAALSLLAATALAWWRFGRAGTADDRHSPARILGVPLLGEIPEFRGSGAIDHLPTASAPFSQAGEAYSFVLASLGYALREHSAKTVLVTSAVPGEGKSVTTLNLAIAAARDERRVVLVDGDARMRGVTSLAQVEHSVGLSNLRDEQVPVERALIPVPAAGEDGPSIVVIGEGTADTAGFFRTGGFRRAFRRVADVADLVLVDSPPLLAVAETSAMAGQVDGIVLVVKRGTRLELLEDVVEQLQFIGTPLLGYVYNRGEARVRYEGYGGYVAQPPRRGRRRVASSQSATTASDLSGSHAQRA